MVKQFFLGLALIIGLITAASFASAASTTASDASAALTQLHINSDQPQSISITLALSQHISYKLFMLDNPHRLVVDLQDTHLATSWSPALWQGTAITRIRAGTRPDNTLRLVFELAAPLTAQGIGATSDSSSGEQIVFQLGQGSAAANNPAVNVTTATNNLPVNATTTTGNPPINATAAVLNRPTITTSVASSSPSDTTTTVNNHSSSNSNNNNSNDAINQLLQAQTKTTAAANSSTTDNSPQTKTTAANPTITINQATTNSSNNATSNTITVASSSTTDTSASNSATSVSNSNTSSQAITTNDVTAASTAAPDSHAERNVIVVIDPGHGGKDPGTTGPLGIHEKDVVLAISKDLLTMVNKEPGMKGYLTRHGDYFITLRDRLDIARQDKADMFIAIHADAFKNPWSTGSSVYALSERGASSEAARWLAEKENYSELGGINLDNKEDMLRSVLIDLSQNYTINASLNLGDDVLQSLGLITHLHYNTVEQARFVVLKSPDIPSILVETGFLSNPDEEAKLRSSTYQKALAQAIMSGIRVYFWHNPPPGTWIAARKAAGDHYLAQRSDN